MHVFFKNSVIAIFILFIFQCGHTALQRAAGGGHLEIVKLLLSHGATVDHQDEVVRRASIKIFLLFTLTAIKVFSFLQCVCLFYF
jgi:hypothetical protein